MYRSAFICTNLLEDDKVQKNKTWEWLKCRRLHFELFRSACAYSTFMSFIVKDITVDNFCPLENLYLL